MIVHVLRYNKQLPGQSGARPILHNTRVGGMESSSPAALDPEGYVEKFLEMYYPGLNVRHAGRKLLMLREHSTTCSLSGFLHLQNWKNQYPVY